MAYQTLRVEPGGLDVPCYRKGEGTPLLYMHSIAGMPGWMPALEHLAASFDVIAPYAPGWGPSQDWDALDGPLDIALFYSDLLQALKIEQIHVLGISIGAWMAAELAAIFPQRVRRLVLVNPIGMWLDDAPGEDPFAQHPMKPTEVLFAEPSRRATLLMAGRERTDVYVQEVHDLKAAAKFLWPIPDTGVCKRLPRIGAPTLVVSSDKDRVILPPHGVAWQQAIPGAQLTTLAGAGHLADLEQPQAFARLAAEFFLIQ
jgi:pimeloyl-ACP methyl ester carboxylesterase